MNFLTLQSPMRWTFLFHATMGALALGILLVPLLSKKGGKVHVKAGWVYSFAMILVGLSTFIITPWRGFLDPNRTSASQGFAFFLFFIAVFTLCALTFGIRVLKHKSRLHADRSLASIGPPIFLIALGLVTQIAGFYLSNVLLMIFPFIAYLTAKEQLAYWLTRPQTKMHWWYAHMSGMFTACIATITAFLVTALPRISTAPALNSPLLWIAPGLILGPILKKWTADYQKKFEKVQTS